MKFFKTKKKESFVDENLPNDMPIFSENSVFQKIRSLIAGTTEKPPATATKRGPEWPIEYPNVLKYRRVTNEFPKIITQPFEDDIRCSQPQPVVSKKISFAKKVSNKFLSSKQGQMSKQNRSVSDFAETEYSDDDDDDIEFIHSTMPLASSSFTLPEQISANNFYGHLNKSKSGQFKYPFNECSNSSQFAALSSKFNNVPVVNVPKNLENKKQIPHLIEAKTGNIFGSIPNLKTIRRTIPMLNQYVSNSTNSNGLSNNYSNDVITNGISGSSMNQILQPHQLQKNSIHSEHRQSICNRRNAKSFASNSLFPGNRKSVVSQVFNIEQRNKYADLLQSLVPHLYRSSLDQSTAAQNLGSPSARRPIHSNLNGKLSSKTENIIDSLDLTDDEKRKTTSVINVDDDVIDLDDDEMTIVSAYKKLNKTTNYKTKDEQNKRVELPKVDPVNTLEEKNNLSIYYGDQWLQKFVTEKEIKQQLRQEKILNATEEARKLSEETERHERDIEKKLKNFIIAETILVDDSEEEEEIEFPVINDNDHNLIKHSIYSGSPDEILITKFNMNITRRDIQTLMVDTWLNDEVINFYMNLIMERGDKREDLPKVYTMNTFFVPRLESSGYSGVRRWTRKVDIFSYDLIAVPVHVSGVHWCMAIINLREKTINYYDSMGSPHPTILKLLEQYLIEESYDKKKEKYDTTNFTKLCIPDCPKQLNGSDCGVFSCMTAEYISRSRNLTFSQHHMGYFRHKMILEIVKGKLLL